ncbi:MAG: Holliday junction branch migration protein RuvA [Pelotomaculaceae bacterium]|jgi:Holliday junction DNA helicase RuvA|uniref:Holliday junction ATP-dependent DNA helicase RuvA n=1 Tax=anaerobic digester metagenome TaxID=1263854 RepID=A0A485M571_9ZZZZ|nr:Holliday junction branch migration protein RuvA [Peptococcaceae bacterium]
MIAFIRGKLAGVLNGSILLDVGGIGYEIQVPLNLLNSLNDLGSEVTLHTHLAVREDNLSLYGFKERDELDCFLKLINVSGIGPRGGLAILTIFSPGELTRIIKNEDIPSLTRVPGIGKKTAGRLILELKDKISWLEPEQDKEDAGRWDLDAVEALEALGYPAAESRRAVQEALRSFDQKPPEAELVKAALRLLVKL